VTEMKRRHPIGVFDSGLGGLTVVKSLMERLPDEDLLYLGDTARVPYGSKSQEAISIFAREGAAFLMSQDIKLLVIACNTMSATVLPALSSELSVPVIGVISPGVTAACAGSETGRIGIIGTTATIASQSYRRGILALRPDAQVFSQASPLFVPLVEEGWEETEVALMVARHYLGPLIAQNIDMLVLGCTHYPLLIPTLQRIAGSAVALVDSASQTAIQVESCLEEKKLTNPEPSGKLRFYLTDIPPSFIGVAERFLSRPVAHVERVDLS